MKLKSYIISIGCFFFIEFGILSTTNLLFAQTDIFKEIDLTHVMLTNTQNKILDMIQQDTTTIAVKVVEVDVYLLAQAHAVALSLFSGKNFISTTSRIDKRSAKDFDWYGNAPAKPDYALLSVYRDAVAGFVIVDGEIYNVRPLGEGLQALIHADPTKGPRCGNLPISGGINNMNDSHNEDQSGTIVSEQDYYFKKNSTSVSSNLQSFNTEDTIKVLVAYTPAAKAEAGPNGIEAVINSAFAAANLSYDSSNVLIDLQIAHKVEVDYTENSLLGPPFSDECSPPQRRRRLALIDF